jgi:hypothetical protein
MSILIVYCDLNRSDAKSFKTRLSILSKEIQKGRRPDQISSNGSIYFVQTPESAKEFTARIAESGGMNEDKDRLAVIDAARGKAYIWGNFESELKVNFPFVVNEFEM